MTVSRHILLSLPIYLAVCGVSSAKDIYIAQIAQGGGGGNSCATANAAAFFNSSSNWGTGASQIGAGTTVHICGTITGGSNATGFTFQGSGTSASPITLLFEPGAILTSTNWSTNGAIITDGQSYVVVDGGSNGLIQDTLNGTPGGACPAGPCTSQTQSTGISLNSCLNCTVQNLTISNLYMRTSQSDEQGGGACFNAQANSVTSTNLVLNNNTCHDVGSGMYWEYRGTGSNAITLTNNTIYNISAGFMLADFSGVTSKLTSALIYGNYVHDFANWSDQCCGYNYHHDGIHLWAVHNGATVSGVYVYNNTFGGDFGAGTAQIYFEIDGTNNTATGYFFNNIFNPTGDTGTTSGGGAAFWVQTAGGSGNSITFYAYNNTLTSTNIINGMWLEGGGGTITGKIENNIIQNFGTPFVTTTGGMLSTLVQDYNNWYCPSSTCGSYGNGVWDDNGDDFSTLSSWRAYSSLDIHSVLANPLVNSNWVPQTGGAAIGMGTNLYSVCNGQPNPGLGALCFDKSGVARPATPTLWDVGAYQSGSTGGGSPPPNGPNPPTTLTLTVF